MKKKELKSIARTKERFLDIVNLLKNKKYDEIFTTYGQRIYCLVVPKSYKKSDINKMFKDEQFEQIHRKYGKYGENWYINKDNQIETCDETLRVLKGKFKKIKNKAKRVISSILIALPIALPIATIAGQEVMHIADEIDGATKYAKEIEEYDRELIKNAEQIKKMNLTDIQIFAKVIKDMWDGIEGYANPNKEISGNYRLSLKNEGIGECRHFADHITAQLNAINPEYNARNVLVYISKVEKLANIKRNIIENNETVDDNNGKQDENNNKFDFTHLTGNHMVTAVDIPGKNISLIIDATNPSIGVFVNGRIHMFSSHDGKGIQLTETFQVLQEGIMSVIDLDQTVIKSFLPTEESLEELEDEYGVDALNKALVEVADIEKKLNIKNKKIFVAKAEVNEGKALKGATEKANQTAKDNEIAD